MNIEKTSFELLILLLFFIGLVSTTDLSQESENEVKYGQPSHINVREIYETHGTRSKREILPKKEQLESPFQRKSKKSVFPNHKATKMSVIPNEKKHFFEKSASVGRRLLNPIVFKTNKGKRSIKDEKEKRSMKDKKEKRSMKDEKEKRSIKDEKKNLDEALADEPQTKKNRSLKVKKSLRSETLDSDKSNPTTGLSNKNKKKLKKGKLHQGRKSFKPLNAPLNKIPEGRPSKTLFKNEGSNIKSKGTFLRRSFSKIPFKNILGEKKFGDLMNSDNLKNGFFKTADFLKTKLSELNIDLNSLLKSGLINETAFITLFSDSFNKFLDYIYEKSNQPPYNLIDPLVSPSERKEYIDKARVLFQISQDYLKSKYQNIFQEKMSKKSASRRSAGESSISEKISGDSRKTDFTNIQIEKNNNLPSKNSFYDLNVSRESPSLNGFSPTVNLPKGKNEILSDVYFNREVKDAGLHEIFGKNPLGKDSSSFLKSTKLDQKDELFNNTEKIVVKMKNILNDKYKEAVKIANGDEESDSKNKLIADIVRNVGKGMEADGSLFDLIEFNESVDKDDAADEFNSKRPNKYKYLVKKKINHIKKKKSQNHSSFPLEMFDRIEVINKLGEYENRPHNQDMNFAGKVIAPENFLKQSFGATVSDSSNSYKNNKNQIQFHSSEEIIKKYDALKSKFPTKEGTSTTIPVHVNLNDLLKKLKEYEKKFAEGDNGPEAKNSTITKPNKFAHATKNSPETDLFHQDENLNKWINSLKMYKKINREQKKIYTNTLQNFQIQAKEKVNPEKQINGNNNNKLVEKVLANEMLQRLHRKKELEKAEQEGLSQIMWVAQFLDGIGENDIPLLVINNANENYNAKYKQPGFQNKAEKKKIIFPHSNNIPITTWQKEAASKMGKMQSHLVNPFFSLNRPIRSIEDLNSDIYMRRNFYSFFRDLITSHFTKPEEEDIEPEKTNNEFVNEHSTQHATAKKSIPISSVYRGTRSWNPNLRSWFENFKNFFMKNHKKLTIKTKEYKYHKVKPKYFFSESRNFEEMNEKFEPHEQFKNEFLNSQERRLYITHTNKESEEDISDIEKEYLDFEDETEDLGNINQNYKVSQEEKESIPSMSSLVDLITNKNKQFYDVGENPSEEQDFFLNYSLPLKNIKRGNVTNIHIQVALQPGKKLNEKYTFDNGHGAFHIKLNFNIKRDIDGKNSNNGRAYENGNGLDADWHHKEFEVSEEKPPRKVRKKKINDEPYKIYGQSEKHIPKILSRRNLLSNPETEKYSYKTKIEKVKELASKSVDIYQTVSNYIKTKIDENIDEATREKIYSRVLNALLKYLESQTTPKPKINGKEAVETEAEIIKKFIIKKTYSELQKLLKSKKISVDKKKGTK